jgi:hypothetical protein
MYLKAHYLDLGRYVCRYFNADVFVVNAAVAEISPGSYPTYTLELRVS